MNWGKKASLPGQDKLLEAVKEANGDPGKIGDLRINWHADHQGKDSYKAIEGVFQAVVDRVQGTDSKKKR